MTRETGTYSQEGFYLGSSWERGGELGLREKAYFVPFPHDRRTMQMGVQGVLGLVGEGVLGSARVLSPEPRVEGERREKRHFASLLRGMPVAEERIGWDELSRPTPFRAG
jgi:hypothetical protein